MPEKRRRKNAQNLLDWIELPSEQVDILRIVLRHGRISLRDLEAALQKLPAWSSGQAQLAPALDALTESDRLMQIGEGAEAEYRLASLRRSGFRTPTLALSRRGQSTTLWDMLQSLEEEATSGSGVRLRLAEWLKTFFGKHAPVIILLLLSVASTFAVAVLDVVGVSGFVSTVGTTKLPWLWIGDTAISLVIAGIFIQFVDRLPRIRMMKILIGCLIAAYLIIASLFFLSANRYPLPDHLPTARPTSDCDPNCLLEPGQPAVQRG